MYPTTNYEVPILASDRTAGHDAIVPMPALPDGILPLTSPSISESHAGESGHSHMHSPSTAIIGTQTVPPQPRISVPSLSVPASTRVQDSPQRLAARNSRTSQAGNKQIRGKYDPQVWESHKEKIRHLYLEQDKPLREVIQTMAQAYNFHATEKMFKMRIKQWGFIKNNTRRDVAQMLRARFVREAMGKRSEFKRNGRAVNIDNYLWRKGLTEYDVVDLESPVEEALRIVRCRTPPDPECLALPDMLKRQEGYVLAVRRALMFWATDPREKDKGYWLTKTYTYIKDLKDAQGLVQEGDTGRAIQTLQTVLQTTLRDIDQVDSAGGLWLLLVPATWAHAPIITTPLFKYVVASSVVHFEPPDVANLNARSLDTLPLPDSSKATRVIQWFPP